MGVAGAWLLRHPRGAARAEEARGADRQPAEGARHPGGPRRRLPGQYPAVLRLSGWGAARLHAI